MTRPLLVAVAFLIAGCSSSPTDPAQSRLNYVPSDPVPTRYAITLIDPPGTDILLLSALKPVFGVTEPEATWFAGAARPWEPIQVRLDMPTHGQWLAKIYSMRSERRVWAYSGFSEAGSVIIAWDGHDEAGNPVQPGEYLLTVEVRGYVGSVRLILAP